MRIPLRAALLISAALLLPAAAVLVAAPTPASCHLQVIPDYTLGVTYRAVLRPSPGCGASAVLRVRKSSTINTVRSGARYQPIKPATGAWEVGALAVRRPVPADELWTLYNWRWEYWAAAKGRWVAGEVLRAAP